MSSPWRRKGGLIIAPIPASAARMGASRSAANLAPRRFVDWHSAVTNGWPMCANDVHGCCVPASMQHMAQMRMANVYGSEWRPTDDLTLKAYSDIAGFDPTTGANDDGTTVAEAMAYWAVQGMDLGLQTKDVSLHVHMDSIDELRLGIDTFLGAMICLSLPLSAKTATDTLDICPDGLNSLLGKRGGWTSHALTSGYYDMDRGIFKVITWGTEMVMTEAFLDAYAVSFDTGFSSLILETDGTSPSGLTRAQLVSEIFS
jgi:hypothetical protein